MRFTLGVVEAPFYPGAYYILFRRGTLGKHLHSVSQRCTPLSSWRQPSPVLLLQEYSQVLMGLEDWLGGSGCISSKARPHSWRLLSPWHSFPNFLKAILAVVNGCSARRIKNFPSIALYATVYLQLRKTRASCTA
jgi:hypothetical protein